MADGECELKNLRLSPRHLLATNGLLAKVDFYQHLPPLEATLEYAGWGNIGNSRVYTDCSMVDGHTTALGRVGFGFVAYSEEEQITAKAYGVVPRWIDSVAGAEAWALADALRCSMPVVTIWSDYLEVVERFKSGRCCNGKFRANVAHHFCRLRRR